MKLIWMYITFLLMIATNILAESLPLNGLTTGEISHKYQALFTPANYTFIIWSIIYLALFIWLIMLVVKRIEITEQIAACFIATNVLNLFWLICWHFEWIFISLVIMGFLLFVLSLLYRSLRGYGKFRWPISLYISWIFVAMISNINYFFHTFGQANFFGIQEATWSILFLMIGFIVGLYGCYRLKDRIFSLVIIWAYLGIFFHDFHLSSAVSYVALALAILLFILILKKKSHAH
ncbi:tryptophan-rich sensory protein [Listeria sp. PSOL-1]|uniref:tryptophan-rich sensory protein n=1 Tax=Listeria sp. PSOL-1 TaxID=1844999 RepID=UPI0013D2C17E|nr:tryptophan-rich sensory protein [Listeria sp. PSOL-1]